MKRREITLEKFQEILLLICDKKTSQSPNNWKSTNPLWGHCAVVSLLAQDLFGGELLRASLEDLGIGLLGGAHYWNRFPDELEHDFTIQQFEYQRPDRKRLSPIIRERSYLLSNSDTLRRYELLKKRFTANV
jgi:hypothetical protein